MSSTWTSWLNSSPQSSVCFFLNTLADPNPVKRFYQQDWIDEAFSIYQGTDLAHLSEVGPWLVKVKPSRLANIGIQLDNSPFSDNSWGWAYHSQLDWKEQIIHWQKHQIVTINEKKRMFRFFDARIARTLLPKLREGDWSTLMRPIDDCFIEQDGEGIVYPRMRFAPPATCSLHFEMRTHLTDAWRDSEQSMINMIDNYYIQFWEKQSELAYQLDEPEGRLHTLIRAWVNECHEKSWDISFFHDGLFINYLVQNNYLKETTGTVNGISI